MAIAKVTKILVLGSPRSQARLSQILDAAVVRLGLSELAVVAGGDADNMVCAWNLRRYQLTRYFEAEPVGDVAIVFGAYFEAFEAGRIIYVDKGE